MPEVNFLGPTGRLEGRYHKGPDEGAPIALVLHPHPRYGGTMNNKVVYGVYQVFAERGFSVLRFNFRGVGRSQGVYDGGAGELSDAAAALDWLQSVDASAKGCWIAGFSFGAWISMQLLMRRPEVSGFISISPPANLFDFSFLAPCPSSGLIVHGTQDDLVPEASVAKLAQRLSQQRGIAIEYQKIKGATHFYEGKLAQVTAVVGKHIDAALERLAA
jgi:alpha/beta superfamily hydrolase